MLRQYQIFRELDEDEAYYNPYFFTVNDDRDSSGEGVEILDILKDYFMGDIVDGDKIQFIEELGEGYY